MNGIDYILMNKVRSDVMLVGLYVSASEDVSKNLVAMLSEKFQGIKFVALKNLSQDLTMATLASGSFDKIIIYVNVFNGCRTDDIIRELQALKDYKELRAIDVNIQLVDRVNTKDNTGILDMAYRKFFGSFVDCQYYIKNEFSGATIIDLIRDANIQSDYMEKIDQPQTVNQQMVNALSSKESRESRDSRDVVPEKIQEPVRNVEIPKPSVSKTEEVTKKPVKTNKVDEPVIINNMGEPTGKRGFSFFGKNPFNIKKPVKQDDDLNQTTKEEIPQKVEPKSKQVENSILADANEYKDMCLDAENDSSDTIEMREHNQEEIVQSKEEYSEFYGDIPSNTTSEQSFKKFKSVESAVSRKPEVIDKGSRDEDSSIKYRDVAQNLDSPFGNTNLFNIPTELSNDEILLRKQMELKELELKARMLEAQAQIKNTELETAQRNSLVSPVRMSEERVIGYVNNTRGRAKLILVTGLKSAGKTTLAKLMSEILQESGFTLSIDLDLDGRTLSNTFSNIGDEDLTRLGLLRSLRDLNRIEDFICPINQNLDVLGTLNDLSESEEISLEKRYDISLISPMLRKVVNSGIYEYIVVDCPLETLNQSNEIIDICDYVIWTGRGSKYGISSLVRELSKDDYDEFFFNKLTIVLNGETNQNSAWNKFFNTHSMWSDSIADSLGAIVPYIDNYDECFWRNNSGIVLNDLRTNLLDVLN